MKRVFVRDGKWQASVWDERFMDEPGMCGRVLQSGPLGSEAEARRWVAENHDRWIRIGDELL